MTTNDALVQLFGVQLMVILCPLVVIIYPFADFCGWFAPLCGLFVVSCASFGDGFMTLLYNHVFSLWSLCRRLTGV